MGNLTSFNNSEFALTVKNISKFHFANFDTFLNYVSKYEDL